jgi:hypothetical protein
MGALEKLSNYVLIPAIGLYLTGWAYLYHFLLPLGVSISVIEADPYTVLIYSISVVLFLINSLAFWVLLASLVIVVVSWRYAIRTRMSRKIRLKQAHDWVVRRFGSVAKSAVVTTLVYAVVLLVCFGVAREAGVARAQAVRIDPPGPTIYLQFTQEFLMQQGTHCEGRDGCYYRMLFDANRRGGLREILETTDYFVLIDFSRNAASEHETIVLPRRYVAFSWSQ